MIGINNIKKIVLLPLIVVFLSSMKGEERKWALEFSLGYSFGVASYYKKSVEYWRIPPLSPEDKYFKRYELGLPFRLAVIYYLSKRFALQGEIEYQPILYHRWGGSAMGYIDKKEDKSRLVPYLNIIYFFNEKKGMTPYFGLGIGVTHFIYYVPYPAFKGGVGLKFALTPKISLNLGCFIYSYGYDSGITKGDHISLKVGLEI